MKTNDEADCLLLGHKLLHEQSDVPIDGWSVECRVYAEQRETDILVTWLGTHCNTVTTASTGHVSLLRPLVFRHTIALDTRQEVAAIVATC